MSSINTAGRLIIMSPRKFFKASFDLLNSKGLLHWLGDASFARISYWLRFGETLDLKNPRKFNEKLQWLKLHDRRSEYINMVDKIAMKDIVAANVGQQYAIPTLGIWEKVDDIEWDKLPSQFVIKWNHDSGSIVICKDKESFNREAAINKLRYGEKYNGFWYGREWPYKGVKPKLLAEPYLEDSVTGELRDYKVFSFNGKVKLFLVASDRQKKGESVKFDYFDIKGTHLNITNDHPQAQVIPALPKSFNQMIELTEKISAGLPHLRVDFYEVDGRAYIGEFTLYHGSGLMSFKPDEWNEVIGDWITLPDKK